jgi:thiol-disulfide isomerase/thioredoxin
MTENSSSPTPGPSSRRSSWVPALIGVAALAAVLGVGGVYGMGGFTRKSADSGVCTAAQATAKRVSPLVRGDIAALTVPAQSRPLPELAFTAHDGQKRTLADFRGRTVLLNLWATWCVPCRKEMPALDELQAKLGSPAFEVVAINIDTRDPDKPRKWLTDTKIDKLAYYADPSAKIFQELKAAGKAFGMPTTLLIDPSGCEIASLAGPAEWAGEDAVKFIRAALGS